MIEFKDVQKIYQDGFEAIKGVSFSVNKGEFVAIIGPSGCGKTTTMKMINRLIEVSSGTILVDGEDIKQKDPVNLRRNIGYVIQQIGLLPHMTVEDNISLVPKLMGGKKDQYDKKVDELLHLIGLNPIEYRKKFPLELSGGQQQRVGVARALAGNPPVVLMDEPFSALDPISREQLQDELKSLQKKIQKTIVFVTHDIDEAFKLADRIIIMDNGKIVQFDTPSNILHKPANLFVKEFIGQDRMGNVYSDKLLSYILPEFPQVVSDDEALCDFNPSNLKKGPLVVLNKEGKYLGVLHGTNTTLNSSYPSILKEDSPEKAVLLMLEHHIDMIPVLENLKVVGVITKDSILKASFLKHEGEVYI